MGKVGTKLQEIREKYGMNQAEMAKRLGFSRSYIAMVEAEKTQIGGFIPSLDFIRTLATSFSLNRNKLERLRDSDKQDYMKRKKKTPVHLVPVLNSVSAAEHGKQGNPSEEVEEWMEVDENVTDPDAFALRVAGDSMEPEFREGEYVVIAPALQWKDGDYVAIGDSDGEKALKKIRVIDDHIVLMSENPKYGPTILEGDDDPRVVGKVIRKVKKY